MGQELALSKQINTLSTDCVRIIQITDSHIFSEDEGKLLGLNTRVSLEAVLERINKEEFAPDMVLVTGDLSQDASENSYQYLYQKLQDMGVPCFWIPGNHDSPEVMAKILKGGNVYPEKQLLSGNWQIVMLDSSVTGKVYGNISQQDVELLERAQQQYPDKHLLVVMHHQPVPVGSDWLDNLGIKNAQVLFDSVQNHQATRCFLWGHVHQDYSGEHQGVTLLSTPSTCVQFKPGSSDFSAGEEAPGYRYLTLHNNGQIESVVHRIHDIEFTVDYTIKGY